MSGKMEWWNQDAELAALLRNLIAHRLQEDSREWLGITVGEDDQGRFYRFMVGESIFVQVLAYIELDGVISSCQLVLFESFDRPAAYLMLRDDYVGLKGRPQSDYLEVVASIQHWLVHGIVPPKLNMLYGFVEEGTVIALWFATLQRGDVEGAQKPLIFEFVLEGHQLPSPLLLRGSNRAAWAQLHWDLIPTGQIVELWDRVVFHPGSLWHQHADWTHMWFDQDDGLMPLLPENLSYFLRYASDDDQLVGTRRQATINHQIGPQLTNMKAYFTQFEF